MPDGHVLPQRGQWRKLLCECGFDVQATPMSEGTPFANVLLVAHAK